MLLGGCVSILKVTSNVSRCFCMSGMQHMVVRQPAVWELTCLSTSGSATAFPRKLGRELQTLELCLLAVEREHQATLLARCAVGTMVCNCTASSSAAAN